MKERLLTHSKLHLNNIESSDSERWYSLLRSIFHQRSFKPSYESKTTANDDLEFLYIEPSSFVLRSRCAKGKSNAMIFFFALSYYKSICFPCNLLSYCQHPVGIRHPFIAENRLKFVLSDFSILKNLSIKLCVIIQPGWQVSI